MKCFTGVGKKVTDTTYEMDLQREHDLSPTRPRATLCRLPGGCGGQRGRGYAVQDQTTKRGVLNSTDSGSGASEGRQDLGVRAPITILDTGQQASTVE